MDRVTPININLRVVAALIQHMQILNDMSMLFMLILLVLIISKKHLLRASSRYKLRSVYRSQIRQINYHTLIHESDLACLETTRMDRKAFSILCGLLRTRGNLSGTKNMNVEEMVAMFLHILSHDLKNRMVKRLYARSGETISRHFNAVLNAVLRLHELLLKKPEPIPENSTDERWKWFKVTIKLLYEL